MGANLMSDGKPNATRAQRYATVVHGGQVYNDEVPYVDHLTEVYGVVKRFGLSDDEEIASAAWLHDSIEDTRTSYNDIAKRFGASVAELVYCVTDERGRNRKERHAKTYPKIKGNVKATQLKLADRIANVEYGSANGGKQDMYRKEQAEFEEGIRMREGEPLITSRMWDHLGRILGLPVGF
jgi:(p)ppGpp synthase/HD superfamily hydrolase